MRKRFFVLAFAVLALAAAPIAAQQLTASLDGDQEVPAVSTVATGEFKATVNPGGASISYELTYSNLEGTPTQAFIHFGQEFANGGPIFVLCGAGFVGCQIGSPVQITGTLTAASLVPAQLQGIESGEFGVAVDAMLSGLAYVNVYTTKFPNGEIRGQIAGPGGGGDGGGGSGPNQPGDEGKPGKGPKAGKQSKALVCHHSAGESPEWHLISIAAPALKAHVGEDGHGDCEKSSGNLGEACTCP